MLIEQYGSFFELDTNGFLVNPASASNINKKWLNPVNELTNLYLDSFTDNVISVYLRGSVPRGMQKDNISDIDSFCIVRTKEHKNFEKKLDIFKRKRNLLSNKYPFVNGFESGFILENKLGSNKYAVMLNQSTCLYGKVFDVKKIKPGIECLISLPKIKSIHLDFIDFKQKNRKPEERKSFCEWYTKQLLRAGFEATMFKSGKYTRDLYLCSTEIGNIYPKYKHAAYQMLNYAINPTDDIDILEISTEEFTNWLINESRILSKQYSFELE